MGSGLPEKVRDAFTLWRSLRGRFEEGGYAAETPPEVRLEDDSPYLDSSELLEQLGKHYAAIGFLTDLSSVRKIVTEWNRDRGYNGDTEPDWTLFNMNRRQVLHRASWKICRLSWDYIRFYCRAADTAVGPGPASGHLYAARGLVNVVQGVGIMCGEEEVRETFDTWAERCRKYISDFEEKIKKKYT